MPSLRAIICIFRIHLARLRAEAGPFLLAALIFPSAMYLFANAISGNGADQQNRSKFLAGSIVFSLSLTAISWLGYLLLENRFTGRLKLFATASFDARCSALASIAASVVMKQSIVAWRGIADGRAPLGLMPG